MKKKKVFVASFISLMSAFLIILLSLFGFFEPIELKTYDYRCRLFSSPKDADPNVVIVAIDEKSLQEFKKQGIVWKWPRDIYGELIDYLSRGGARVIVFDILFAEPDFDRANSDAEETDGFLAQAIEKAGNVVLACTALNDPSLVSEENTLARDDLLVPIDSDIRHSLPEYSGVVFPIDKFQSVAAAIGAVNFYADSEDGVCRRIEPFVRSKNPDIILPHMGISAYRVASGLKSVKKISRSEITFDTLNIPLDTDGRYLIRWYGKGGPNGCFKYYSFASLIASSLQERMKQSPIVASSTFKDKIVIVGANAAALADLQNTPVTIPDSPYPGMEIYATIMSNLLKRDFIRRSHPFVPIVVIVLFALMVTFPFIYGMRAGSVGGLSVFIIMFWLFIAGILFKTGKIWIEVVAPISSVVLSFASSAAVSYQIEGRARKRLKNIFSRYLSPVVISEIIEKTEEDVGLGGKEIFGSVYFSDIKDFTTIGESMSPPDLVALLNDYFGIVTEEILLRRGLLDKYIGDAVMAIFGAPLTHPDHAIQACNSALAVQQAIIERWKRVGRGYPVLETRIGINTGPMVVGNIGSSKKLEYTAIGDTVNLASRLERSNKIYKTKIIINSTTLQLTRDLFVVRELDLLRVEGRKEPTSIYELVGFAGEVEESILRWICLYHEGFTLYREGQFRKAKQVFERVLVECQEDGPSIEYLRRCDFFISNPPPEDWDGMFNSKTK